jgi:hypothetical protein
MDVIQHNNNQNCISDNSDIKARKILVDMKKLATESQISTQNIIAKCVENVEQSVTSKFPATILMKRTIQKTRKNAFGSPSESMNLIQFPIIIKRLQMEKNFFSMTVDWKKTEFSFLQ